MVFGRLIGTGARATGRFVAKRPVATAVAGAGGYVAVTQADKIGGAIGNVGEGVKSVGKGTGNALNSVSDNLPLILIGGGAIALALLLRK